VKILFLEIGHIGYQKIENLMLISKMQTYLNDKMPPKNLEFSNLANLENSFLILTFLGGILSLRQV
jgi:hypothetical protein